MTTMKLSDFSVDRSVRFAREITRDSGSNFVPAFRLLPTVKRRGMEVLYAFNRFTDDIADITELSREARREALDTWADVLAEAVGFPGSETNGPAASDANAFWEIARKYPNCEGVLLLPAVKMLIERFELPRDALFHVIEGVESDIQPQRFETFDDAADYCHKVATSVGFASLAVWGTTRPLFSPEIVKCASACGIAFQWTNILRDLAEDFAQGRLYLPTEELERVGLTENQFGALLDQKTWNAEKKKPKSRQESDLFAYRERIREMQLFEEKFERLFDAQINRTEGYFRTAGTLDKYLEHDGRRIFRRMFAAYHALFRKIAARPERVLRGRVTLSLFDKGRLLFAGRPY